MFQLPIVAFWVRVCNPSLGDGSQASSFAPCVSYSRNSTTGYTGIRTENNPFEGLKIAFKFKNLSRLSGIHFPPAAIKSVR